VPLLDYLCLAVDAFIVGWLANVMKICKLLICGLQTHLTPALSPCGEGWPLRTLRPGVSALNPDEQILTSLIESAPVFRVIRVFFGDPPAMEPCARRERGQECAVSVRIHRRAVKALLGLMVCCSAMGADTRQTATHKRVKAALDAVPAIDTHDHLWPFETLPGYVETERGHGMNLSSIWRNSYYSGLTRSRNGRRRPSAEL